MAQKFSKEDVDKMYDNTKRMAYSEGWHDGYKHAIDDIRQEFLTIEAGMKAHISIDSTEIYEMLNFMERNTHNGAEVLQ